MSMLSAQCDELRERAATLRQGRWSDGADDARLMEDAAETILSLRDRAQDLQAKNANLRELVLHMYTCMGNVDADGNHECFSCEYEGSECDYGCRMRELGIEVDG